LAFLHFTFHVLPLKSSLNRDFLLVKTPVLQKGPPDLAVKRVLQTLFRFTNTIVFVKIDCMRFERFGTMAPVECEIAYSLILRIINVELWLILILSSRWLLQS
jgi:hypothetical protein